MNDFDVAILGAGPAGSSAAIELARRGQRVLLLEKRQFPRDKVCGGCLSADAVQQLWALLGGDAALPGRPAERLRFYFGRRRMEPRLKNSNWLVSRAELDDRLAQEAVSAGARVEFDSPATAEKAGARWIVRTPAGVIVPRWMIVATGISGLARKIARPMAARRSLIGQQWTQPCEGHLPGPGEVEMHWLRGGYVGLAGLASGECIVALAVETARLGSEQPLDCLRRLNPCIELLDKLPRDPRVEFAAAGTTTFPWRPRRVADRNLLLAGDAAGFAEPFTGEGIGQALRSGRLAAQAILRGGDVPMTYAGLMRQRHRQVIRRTTLLAAILKSRVLQLAARVPQIPAQAFAPLVAYVHATPSSRERGVQLST